MKPLVRASLVILVGAIGLLGVAYVAFFQGDGWKSLTEPPAPHWPPFTFLFLFTAAPLLFVVHGTALFASTFTSGSTRKMAENAVRASELLFMILSGLVWVAVSIWLFTSSHSTVNRALWILVTIYVVVRILKPLKG